MNVEHYLFICCIVGGVCGAGFRYGYPFIHACIEKRKEYPSLRLIPLLLVGGAIGVGVAVFFNSDLRHFDQVPTSYLQKLGLLCAIFTMATIDRLDAVVLKRLGLLIQK